jgi:hypothetical protein
MSAHHYKTWAEAAGLAETSAPLSRLPASLKLPENFPEPLRYDPAAKRLVYRGFMCSSSYTFLRGCCKDLEYLYAVDSLFQQTAAARSGKSQGPKKHIGRWLLAVVGVAGAALVAWWLIHG